MKALSAGRQGFTLIELLVAVSIGIMLIVGGTVAANNFNARQKVEAVSSQIAEVVNLARNYAVTREKPAGYTDPVEYVVVTLSVGGTATLKVMAGNNTRVVDTVNTYTTRKIDIKDVSLTAVNDGDLIFSVPEGKLLKYYDVTHRLAVTRDDATDVEIRVVSDVDATYEKKIDISVSGVIEEK
ncbi:MAG: type II secretion system protein [Candidatus Shapirobacteria bacterium]|nr:type II secretion system protein [Candidatus Shapirobacteria bacterium]